MKHLGEALDIHAGGIDNAFPTIPMRSPSPKASWVTSGAIIGSMYTI